MSEKVVTQTSLAPAPVGPYAQAVKAGGFLFLSGQIGLDPKTSRLAGSDTAAQIERIFKNVSAILEFNGLTLGHVVRCVVYAVDLQDMQTINAAFEKQFIYDPPARTTVRVAGLPLGARVEIEVTALAPAPSKPSAGLGPHV